MTHEYDVDYQEAAKVNHDQAGMKDMDPAFLPIYEKCRQYSMTSAPALYGLYKAIEYLVRNRIAGPVVECGVWRGGSMMLAAEALLSFGDSNRELYLFDTFEGLPEPDKERDVDLHGKAWHGEWLARQVDGESFWGRAELDDVRHNMARTDYPTDNIHYVKGLVEDTLPEKAVEGIALLRMDCDWYAPTRQILQHLYPRLCQGGVLIVDDYGMLRGAKDAVDEYFTANGDLPLLNRWDFSCRIGVKT